MPQRETWQFAEELMNRLGEQFHCRTVITGIHLENRSVGNLGRDTNGDSFAVTQPDQGHAYPGTGDIFASVLLGRLPWGRLFREAITNARNSLPR